MIISPKTAIASGWIRGIRDEAKQVQPNGIDITLDVLKHLANHSASVTENHKVMRSLESVPEIELGSGGKMWDLLGGHVYDGTSEVYVDIPEGIAAIMFSRSTLVRNGVFTMNGLYDAGYKGAVGFTMYPIGGTISIGAGTRVAQIVFVRAEEAGVYAGGYNHAEGTHYTEAKPQPDLVGASSMTPEYDRALANSTRGNTPGAFI